MRIWEVLAKVVGTKVPRSQCYLGIRIQIVTDTVGWQEDVRKIPGLGNGYVVAFELRT